MTRLVRVNSPAKSYLYFLVYYNTALEYIFPFIRVLKKIKFEAFEKLNPV